MGENSAALVRIKDTFADHRGAIPSQSEARNISDFVGATFCV